MEADSWRVRSVCVLKAVCFNILTSKNNTSLLASIGKREIFTSAQSVKLPDSCFQGNCWAKNMVWWWRERRRREGPARGKRLAEFSIYPSSFYTISCQRFIRIMTGRPGFCSWSHHRSVLSFYFPPFLEPVLPSWNVLLHDGAASVIPHGGNEAVVASHLLQHLGQTTQVAVWKVLRLPQVQDHARGTGFGGKVVEISEREGQQPSKFTEFTRRFCDLKLQIRANRTSGIRKWQE